MKRYYLLLLFSFFCVGLLYPQKKRVKNQPYGDQKVFHYGFTMGLHSQDLEFFHTGAVTENGESWFAEIPNHGVGFNVGIIGDLYLTSFLNLRFTPSLYFGDKSITLREQNSGKEVHTNLRSNYLMLPLHLKYSSDRLNNIRPYLIAGPSIGFELSRKRGAELMSRPMAVFIEVGVGCNLYFRYFKLCPELKFCFGLNNVLEKDRKDLTILDYAKYTDALSRMTSRLVVLSFNFE